MHDFIILCMIHLENTGSLSYIDRLNIDILYYPVSKIFINNITTGLIIKFSRYWGAIIFTWQIERVYTVNFCFKTQMFYWQ